MNTWIFQSTSERYDLPGALAQLQTLSWTVNQYPKQIRAGDEVYLWETGPGAGILARGTVLGDPAVMTESEAEKAFWRMPEDGPDERLRVLVGVQDVLPTRLTRAELRSDETLAALPNLKFANATNFLVEPPMATRLAKVFASAGPATGIPAEQRPWLVALFLSRCGQQRPDDHPAPPVQLGTLRWSEAFELFRATLDPSKDPTQLSNSLRGRRDLYDPHFPESGRVGWRTGESGALVRPPTPLSPIAQKVFDEWAQKSCDEMWVAVSPWVRKPSATAVAPAVAGPIVAAVAPVTSPTRVRPIEELADELCLEPEYLRDVEWLLRDKRQLVFYGPPGTGKTFVAEAFAEWFTGDPSRVETVQFHPSYAYEDFIEGIRPALDADQVRYTLGEGGLLKRFANRAAKDPEHRPHVLVIDEINRANLARVFGELLYLLEYRKREVTLPYSGQPFRLPDNLYLIGTMNTADRSIALVDFALRRRFHFVRFDPDVAVLRRWLTGHGVSTEPADLLAWVNREIGDGDFAIGFSHFMRTDLDETILRRVWERSILPALEEFYFEDTERRARFALDRVRAAIKGFPSVAGPIAAPGTMDPVPVDDAEAADEG